MAGGPLLFPGGPPLYLGADTDEPDEAGPDVSGNGMGIGVEGWAVSVRLSKNGLPFGGDPMLVVGGPGW